MFVGPNMITLEKNILLGGYNQLIKGYQSTKKVCDQFFLWGLPTQIIF